jgi:hypothetical protein
MRKGGDGAILSGRSEMRSYPENKATGYLTAVSSLGYGPRVAARSCSEVGCSTDAMEGDQLS